MLSLVMVAPALALALALALAPGAVPADASRASSEAGPGGASTSDNARGDGSAGTSGNARAEGIAKQSAVTKAAMASLVDGARAIKDSKVRAVVLEMLAAPAPTFLSRWPDRAAARQALVDAGLVDANVDAAALFPEGALSFAAAPGGVLGKHHGHPGGLAVHTAFNLRAARALAAVYRQQYGVLIDEDIVIASAILHDAMKACTLQFHDDGSLSVQAMVAGTSSHHPFIVAEAIHRGLPYALVVAIAAAHEPPASNAAAVAGFLKAGALLAGADPLAWQLRSPTDIEASINHLSDHDYVLSDAAYAAVDQALDRVLAPTSDAVALRWQKHALLARIAGLTLYGRLVQGGDEAVRRAIAPERQPR